MFCYSSAHIHFWKYNLLNVSWKSFEKFSHLKISSYAVIRLIKPRVCESINFAINEYIQFSCQDLVYNLYSTLQWCCKPLNSWYKHYKPTVSQIKKFIKMVVLIIEMIFINITNVYQMFMKLYQLMHMYLNPLYISQKFKVANNLYMSVFCNYVNMCRRTWGFHLSQAIYQSLLISC